MKKDDIEIRSEYMFKNLVMNGQRKLLEIDKDLNMKNAKKLKKKKMIIENTYDTWI